MLLLLFIVNVEPVRQRGRHEEVVLLAMNGCGQSRQISSRSTCATSKRLTDFLPANALVITSGGELHDIILQRCEQLLCFVKRERIFRWGRIARHRAHWLPHWLPKNTSTSFVQDLHPSPQPQPHVVADSN